MKLFIWTLCLTLLALDRSPALAQGINLDLVQALAQKRVTLPAPDVNGKTTPTANLTATIELTNLFDVGNVGLQAKIYSTVGPLSAQRKLAIRLTPTEIHLPANNATAITIPVTFDQGKNVMEVNEVFSKWTIGETFRIELLENGDPLPNYRSDVGAPIPKRSIGNPFNMMPHEFWCDIGYLGVVDQAPKQAMDSGYFIVNSASVVTRLNEQDMPTDWRLLQPLDCIVMDAKLLQGPPQSQSVDPEVWLKVIDAIRYWTLNGGVLICVTDSEGLGQSTSWDENSVENQIADKLRLKMTSEWFGEREYNANIEPKFAVALGLVDQADLWTQQALANAANAQASMRFSLPNGGWIPPTALNTTPADLRDLRRWSGEAREVIEQLQRSWSNSIFRSTGAGTVVITDQAGAQVSLVSEIVQYITGFHASPMLRRGVDPILGDSRHQRWLIPGVAQPPVYTFMGILTLFVILVGPIAYRWTTRSHRSHLMFLIAPVLALLTTVSMFTYSILADGFGTVVRVRQLTWVDGQSGDAAERTRSTTFAGISQAGGIRFNKDAEVFLYPNADTAWEDIDREVNEVRQQVRIEEDHQQFSSGFLPSRTQTQFVTHQVRPDLGKLTLGELKPFDSSGATPNQQFADITSTLPFDLTEVLVRSSDGRYWNADRVQAGSTSTVKWVEDVRVSSKILGGLYTQHRPVGAVVSQSRQNRRSEKVRDLSLFANRQISGSGTQAVDGVFEIWLNQYLFVKGDLPNGTFIGLSSISDDVVPISDAEQVESVRYVMGTLP
ncbi:hypothetical protein LOC67_08195 [Stieleria sp. JC731]|uniref:hypothetical protein n=1 Tax=Pirellulaceae TaxID=2691357 RepID=UPI001E3303A4|nr:hypothetical protein [Stieleria sp. JC731]MCC9600539.1 hypothetical protein [Stieleria sp. JC731]